MQREQEVERLIQQAAIISTMMLEVTRAIHGDFRPRHVGAMWEELLVAFVLWQSDTVKEPVTILGTAKRLGIPRSNVHRAMLSLIDQGLACRVKRRYGREVDFVSNRANSRYFRDMREAVRKAGRELDRLFG